MAGEFVVHGERGWGNVAVEAALTLIGAPRRVVDTGATGPERPPATLTAQVPELAPPSGEIAPGIARVVRRVETHPPLAALWAERFPIGLDPPEA
jgi:hypothetical protein